MPDDTCRPDQERFVAPPAEPIVIDAVDDSPHPSGFWRTAWTDLRRNPMFLLSAAMILLVILVCLFPGMFTSHSPHACTTDDSLLGPSGTHWFGTDVQGCDIFSRTIYGARASVEVGVVTALIVFVVGGILGVAAGFAGGWLDVLISRVSDVFFALPLILAAIVILQMFAQRNVWTVIGVLAAFGWPTTARIARGATLSVRSAEYITASRALGASRSRIVATHVVPNVLGPVIVLATISLGVFIVAEATLSYLGIGLPSTSVSWGIDISSGQNLLRAGDPILLYPAGALALTVLSFMMMGDALRDALDPKARTL